MGWLALSPLEFLALFTAASGGAVWLYLLHHRPQPRRVSTLRFWQSIEAKAPSFRRRRIREPWPLAAQILFLLLVLLALADMQWGGGEFDARHVVIVVDTSAWAQAQPDGNGPLLNRVREESLRLVRGLSPGDRVMVLRAESDPATVVPFTVDRARVRRALQSLAASDTAPDLRRALEAARAAVAGHRRSLIAYVGPARIDPAQRPQLDAWRASLTRHTGAGPAPPVAADAPRFLMRGVGPAGTIENRGITQLALRRDSARPDHWHLLAQIRNYGARPASERLRITVAGVPLPEQTVVVEAGATQQARAEFVSPDGGLLEAQLARDGAAAGPNAAKAAGKPGPAPAPAADALAADDQGSAWLPAFRQVRVAVFSASPGAFRSVLAMNPYLRCEFLAPGAVPAALPDVSLYDAPPPSGGQKTHSIVFLRGGQRQSGSGLFRLTAWNPQHPVTRWVRTRDISVASVAEVTPQPADTVLAWAGSAPLMLARQQSPADGGRRMVMLAFDPRSTNLPQQPAFPLLLAGAIEWMTGAIQEASQPLPAGEIAMPAPAEAASAGGAAAGNDRLRVMSPSGEPVGLARRGDELFWMAPRSGIYRLVADGGPSQSLPPALPVAIPVAVNVPPLPASRWSVPSAESASPGRIRAAGGDRSLWRWLLLLALLPLLAEWLLYYPRRSAGPATEAAR